MNVFCMAGQPEQSNFLAEGQIKTCELVLRKLTVVHRLNLT